MENKIEPMKTRKKKSSRPDRVNLDQEAYEKVNGWVEQVNAKFQGIIKVSRSDIANRILKQHSDQLSASDLKAIKEDNFDDTKFALWMANELKRKKSQGEEVSYSELLKKCAPLLNTQARKPRRKKKQVRKRSFTR